MINQFLCQVILKFSYIFHLKGFFTFENQGVGEFAELSVEIFSGDFLSNRNSDNAAHSPLETIR
jgi:hypothetical protein